MSNLSVSQIIMDAQRMASRFKDLDSLSSSLLVEAEGNNRVIESLREFQDDIDSLNRISNNKSNAEMVNRIQQQNAHSSEILKENRELKICIEDYERAMELIMQKYREHTTSKILESQLNLKELANERLWQIIKQQREKIDEMAAVMQRAADIDDNKEYDALQIMSRLRLENKVLRELLQISRKSDPSGRSIRFNEHLLEEKSVQTDNDDSVHEDLSLSGGSLETTNNNSVLLNSSASVPNVIHSTSNDSTGSNTATATAAVDSLSSANTTNNVAVAPVGSDNNNGPMDNVAQHKPLATGINSTTGTTSPSASVARGSATTSSKTAGTAGNAQISATSGAIVETTKAAVTSAT